jgi:hypothetical protein
MEAQSSSLLKGERIGVSLIILSVIGYITAIVLSLSESKQMDRRYLLAGAHFTMMIGLLLFFRKLINPVSWIGSIGIILSFLILLATPVYFFFRSPGLLNINYDYSGKSFNKLNKATAGTKRTVKSYVIAVTISSLANVTVTFTDGGKPEEIPVQLSEVSGLEAVLKQPNIVMYQEGGIKTFMPDNLIAKTY